MDIMMLIIILQMLVQTTIQMHKDWNNTSTSTHQESISQELALRLLVIRIRGLFLINKSQTLSTLQQKPAKQYPLIITQKPTK